MCGIVGHLGLSDSLEIVLEGLKRLEYRGYDSAGVSFLDSSNTLESHKKCGKLDVLKGHLNTIDINTRICIGHTRWATHGIVSEANSHPHSNKKWALIHNGIIENAESIKNDLIKKKYTFSSETDTEVFLKLLEDESLVVERLSDAIFNAFNKITGNSAFVLLNKDEQKIYAIKKGAPLVCGINTKTSEKMVSSDPYALVDMVDKLYFPEDEVLCCLEFGKSNEIIFKEVDNHQSNRFLVKDQTISMEKIGKGKFEHFMLKEIYEQPVLIKNLVNKIQEKTFSYDVSKLCQNNLSKIHIVACGTAYYAGLVIRDYIESNAKVATSVELASEFRYREPILKKDDLSVFVSQSGETADTLAAQSICKKFGLNTLSLVNVEGSTLYRECHQNLLIGAGVEVGVASTKAFTQQCLTGMVLAEYLGNDLKSLDKRLEVLSERMNLLAERIDELLNNAQKIKSIAEKIYNKRGYFYTGRGIYFPMALEGALKLKEIAYVHAEGYASGELKHGPIALIDKHMVNVAIVGPELMDKTIGNIHEIKARRGIIVIFGQSGNEELRKLADYYLPLNFDGLDELSPLYVNVANQLFSYFVAKFKGTDIDKPRNLAKSVTVE